MYTDQNGIEHALVPGGAEVVPLTALMPEHVGAASVIVFGTGIPTACEHSHIDGIPQVQPWN